MATTVLTDAHWQVNSVDLSEWVTEVSLELSADAPEDTAMGDTWRSKLGGGLKNGRVTVTFNGDFANNGAEDKLWADFGTARSWKLRPDSDAAGASNPEYTGDGSTCSVILTDWTPISGSVGDVAKITATYEISGTPTRTDS